MMIQRYKVSTVNAQTAMTSDNDGEYVRWDDVNYPCLKARASRFNES